MIQSKSFSCFPAWIISCIMFNLWYMMINLSNQTQSTAMARFSKRKPDTVIVKDRKLVCPVCENDLFIETRAQLNTAVASLFDVDFANKEARCFVCSECTYIYWFRG